MAQRQPFANVNSLNKSVYGKPSVLGHSIPVRFDPNLSMPQIEPDINILVPVCDSLDLPDSDVETVESISPAEVASLEYRIVGLTWHTPELVNTCHMDSFLSGFARQVRQTHGRLLNKIMHLDPVGITLAQIGEHVLNAKNMIDSSYIKKLWLDCTSDQVIITPYDAAGMEEFSIFQHLYNHSGFNMEMECACGVQFICEPILRGHTLDSIYGIVHGYGGYNQALPLCGDCHVRRSLVSFKPIQTNWMLTVQYKGNDSPDFGDILPVLYINNATYKLLYLGYKVGPAGRNGVSHVVSVQQIRGWWYNYDGLKRASFTLCEDQERFNERNAILQSIVYFKV